MVPVINLKQLRAAVENQTPEERRNNRIRSQELIKAAIESEERYKKLCEEKGIPYTPCVAADNYGSTYYAPNTKPTNRVKLGDIWSK